MTREERTVLVLECLIDTAKRTTDLANVYSEEVGVSVSWEEVEEVLSAMRAIDKASD